VSVNFTSSEGHRALREGASARGRVAKAMLVVGILIVTAPHGHSRDGHAAPPELGRPIRYLPLEQVEPARTAKASDWQSPFCTKWYDGCEACERRNAKAPARCASTPSSGDTATCQRHAILCESVDWDALNEVCAIWSNFVLSAESQKRLLAGETITNTEFGAVNYWSTKRKGLERVIPKELLRTKSRYVIMPSTILGLRKPLTLEALQAKWPGLEIGRADITDYYCRATYQELPPHPDD
jgi:hypothetical protein